MKKGFKKFLTYALTIVTVLSVSTVAYAGFTRQYTPELKGFGITVSTQEHMLISTLGTPSSFKDMVKYDELFDSKDTELLPLKGEVSKTDNDLVNLALKSDTDTIFDSKVKDTNENINSKYMAFNLYFIASSNMNLYLGNDNTIDDIISIDRNATSNQSFTPMQLEKLLNSMRIGFLTYATTYPPGNVKEPKYSDTPVGINIYAKDKNECDDSYKDYIFSKLKYNSISKEGISLASVKKNEVTKIKVVIWLEGNNIDPDVLAAIATLRFHIVFQAVKV